eukprot:1001253-Rhodomonas_salina.5
MAKIAQTDAESSALNSSLSRDRPRNIRPARSPRALLKEITTSRKPTPEDMGKLPESERIVELQVCRYCSSPLLPQFGAKIHRTHISRKRKDKSSYGCLVLLQHTFRKKVDALCGLRVGPRRPNRSSGDQSHQVSTAYGSIF